MTTATMTSKDQRAIQTLKRIGIGAVAGVVAASLAGLLLMIVDPASGSAVEGVFGITAAVAGLSVGVLAIVGTIYAQVKNLWRFVPMSIRAILWALIAISLVLTIVNQFNQLFGS